MCGRYVVHSPLERIMEAFDIRASTFEILPRYNISPAQSVPIVIRQDGESRLEMARWGLIPRWAKDPGIGQRMINARAETIHEKRSFRDLLRSMRCIVVADGFFEWKKEDGRKVPMYITLRDRHPFGLAGLYSAWRDPERKKVMTCTIVTTTANELLNKVHDRMPVILDRGDEVQWLGPHALSPRELMGILKAYPGSGMEAYEVSPIVNRPANDSPENIKRAG